MAEGSSFGNCTPKLSTSLRGGIAPARTMMRWQGMLCSPTLPLNTKLISGGFAPGASFGSAGGGSTRAAKAECQMRTLPARSCAWMASRLASLQTVNSSWRFIRCTVFLAMRPIAFSMPASPAPTTITVSPSYSSGSESVYWTLGCSSPGTPIFRTLPCRPMPRMTLRVV